MTHPIGHYRFPHFDVFCHKQKLLSAPSHPSIGPTDPNLMLGDNDKTSAPALDAFGLENAPNSIHKCIPAGLA